jgi:Cu/Ag efflux pump CusA
VVAELTGAHFSTSAAVGFVSLFGVAIMDGLLLISYFNHRWARGLPLEEAILQGAEKRAGRRRRPGPLSADESRRGE